MKGADPDAEHRAEGDGHQSAAARAQVVAGVEVGSRLAGQERQSEGEGHDGHDHADRQAGEAERHDTGGEQASSSRRDEQGGGQRAVAVLGARADDAEQQ